MSVIRNCIILFIAFHFIDSVHSESDLFKDHIPVADPVAGYGRQET